MTDEEPAAQQDDFVRHVLKLVMVAAPTLSEQRSLQIEKQLRHEWGGMRPYIAKRSPLLRRARENVLATIGTKPDTEVARENGICRSTMYRWLREGRGGDEK